MMVKGKSKWCSTRQSSNVQVQVDFLLEYIEDLYKSYIKKKICGKTLKMWVTERWNLPLWLLCYQKDGKNLRRHEAWTEVHEAWTWSSCYLKKPEIRRGLVGPPVAACRPSEVISKQDIMYEDGGCGVPTNPTRCSAAESDECWCITDTDSDGWRNGS